MTISFSGLLSGLDTSSWVEALVSVKQEKVTTLKTKLSETELDELTDEELDQIAGGGDQIPVEKLF